MKTAVIFAVLSAMAIPVFADSFGSGDDFKLESSRPRKSFRERQEERQRQLRSNSGGMMPNRPPFAAKLIVVTIGPGLLQAQSTANSPFRIKDVAKRRAFEKKMKDLLKREREIDMKTAKLEKDRNMFIANALKGDETAMKALSANMKDLEAQLKEKSAMIADLLAVLRENFDAQQLAKISATIKIGGILRAEPNERLEAQRSNRAAGNVGSDSRRDRAAEERRRRSTFKDLGNDNIERL